MQALNTRYQSRFGFPFILAVKGRQRPDIIANFSARVTGDREEEFRAALDQVHQIAYLRLSDMTATPGGE